MTTTTCTGAKNRKLHVAWRFEKLGGLLGRWLFMGREAEKSNFSVFPIEDFSLKVQI
jgi:hypothetical protein